MRAVLTLLVAAVLSTACSSSVADVDASPDSGAIDDSSATGARILRGPAEDESTPIDPLDADALAFEQPETPLPNDSSDGESEPSATVDENPESDPPADSESTELSRLLDELIAFVEEERGHEFVTRPQVTMLDGAAFTNEWNATIARSAEEEADDYENFTDIYRAMGILEGSDSLEEIWMRFGDAGVLGYYDPDRGDIVLRSDEITAFTKTVLVHELVHALEDQVFGIDRDEYDERDDEIDWTFSALLEGSARVIEGRYRASLTEAERDEETAVRQALPRTVSSSEFTDSFLELQFGRYRYGETFAEALWAGGVSQLDGAFAEPPATSEAVIDPDVFLLGSAADGAIDAPVADGTVFESGLWGEAAWAALFADVFGVAEGRQLADGWGGDQYVAWRTDSETCVRIHVEADNPDALDNYALALEEWSRRAAGREVFYPTAELIRVTSCA